MTDRDRLQDIYDSDDECVEVPLIDLTIEDQAPGPVDIDQRSQNASRSAPSTSRNDPYSQQSDKELPLYRLIDGTIICVGDFVELRCPQHRQADVEHSGDYLRIAKISEALQTGEVSLRGHRFMREKYIVGKSFSGNDPLLGERGRRSNERIGPRLNELTMHIVMREDDNRPAEVQGLEDVPISEVERKHKIIITDKPYHMLSFRDAPRSTYSHMLHMSKAEQHLQIFKEGPLVCRWSITSVVSPNGKIYSGRFRYISKKELPGSQQLQQISRSSPMEETAMPYNRKTVLPSRIEPYTFFDMFCGNGGASRGADQAGLKVVGGLDHDKIAMEAWEQNNPGGVPLCIDSFEFLRNEIWKIIGRVHMLSVSNPCKPYSIAHTVRGKDDEINTAQLYIIKPLIEALKPRVVVLENTSGLANVAENRKYFNKVLNDIHSAGSGYNLRYKIVNMADYGLPQERKRLLIIAARKGTPLPPFPKPTHGPPGSGLKPYVSIGDALKVLDRLGDRAEQDHYHKLHKSVPPQQHVYDPYKKFVDCIVTAGVTSTHWSGEKFTPRELALLQSLPYHHHLTGSWSQATKQVGNMFPPLMAELVYRTCAQTLEAFDKGLIDADEDIDDLDITLLEKGADIPEISHTPTSLFDLTGSAPQSPFRYLSRPVLSDAIHVDHSSAWAKRKFEEHETKATSEKRSINTSFYVESDRDDTPSPAVPRKKHKARTSKEKSFWENHNGKTLVLSDSDEDSI